MFDSSEQSADAQNSTHDEVADDEVIEAQDDLDSDGEAEVQPAEEDEEVEIGDRKVAMPKSLAETLKAERLMHKDYTVKTQSLAEERRLIEQQQSDFARQADEHRADIQEYAKLVSIDSQIEQYNAIQWNQLSADDPAEANRLWIARGQLIEARQGLAGALTQRQQQRQFEQQRESAKQLEAGQAMLAREIKDWSPELAAKLRDFAISDGWSDKEVAAITPAQVKSLHRSYIGAQLLSKQSPTKPQAPAARPAIKVGAAAPVVKDPARMTDSEFAAMRKRQIANRNK